MEMVSTYKMNGLFKMPLTSDSEMPITKLRNRVFNNELLRDMILDYVIHDKKKVDISNAKCCRFVSKAWLHSVSRILTKCQEPFLQISLRQDNYLWGINMTRYETVEKFMATFTEATCVGGRIPTFAITTSFGYLQSGNLQSFYNLLIKYGNSLVELTLTISSSGVPTSMTLSGISLPKLRMFKMHHPRVLLPTAQLTQDQLLFAQSVLDASPQLKIFALDSVHHAHLLPDYFKSFLFPSSITEVDLACVANNEQLEVLLVNNSFSALKTLKLSVNVTPFKAGLVTRILENVRKTLVHFCVRDTGYKPGIKLATRCLMPLMEKLKRLDILTEYFVLEDQILPLPELVPNLHHLSLVRRTPSAFQEWTDNFCFQSVDSLSVHLLSKDGLEQPVIYDLPTMQALKFAFPNISAFDISLAETEIIALQFIMKEMRHLLKLRICVERLPWSEINIHSDLWDSILIGLPAVYRKLLKKYNFLRHRILSKCVSSIRNMTELHTLELCTLSESGPSLISDGAFHFAFFKMPKLTKLILKGDFMVSLEMEREWVMEGRRIEVSFPEILTRQSRWKQMNY